MSSSWQNLPSAATTAPTSRAESLDIEHSASLETADQRSSDEARQGILRNKTNPATNSEKPQDNRHGPGHDDTDPVQLTPDEDPLYWTLGKKWLTTIIVSSVFFNTTLGSSISIGGAEQYMTELGASKLVSVLPLSLYLAGYAIGPLVWGPLSEMIGRKAGFAISTPCFLLFSVGCALAPNLATLLSMRVLAGFFAACPQSSAGATISDIFAPKGRPWPMYIYTVTAFVGPVVGPAAGGFLGVSGHWRWIYWLLVIFAAANIITIVTLLDETYAPVLRKRKARALRKSGHLHATSPLEMHLSLRDIVRVHLVRPFAMLFSPYELPLIYAAVWTGFTYAIIYMFLEAYPVVFGGIYGFNAGETGLCFFGLGLGIALSAPLIWVANRDSARVAQRQGKIVPEARLRVAQLTAPLYVVGFFWFGWTARPNIHWIVPIIATVPIGTSIILSFNALAVYVAQCYHIYTASALSAMACSRCLIATFVPLFSRQMFENLGPGWASSILGFVSLVAIPVPIIISRYGPRIRQHSKMATSF